MNRICEILGVKVNKDFNIIGQNLSNPYRFYEDGVFTTLVNRNGEEVHNWVVCNLINGTLKIEKLDDNKQEKEYEYMFYGEDLCPNNP